MASEPGSEKAHEIPGSAEYNTSRTGEDHFMWMQGLFTDCWSAVRRRMSFAAVAAGVLCCFAMVAVAHSQTGTVRVDATPGHAINSFDPDSALGVRSMFCRASTSTELFTPHIVQESLSAGWGPITYRNNTELRMAAWHWTENGTWSDAAHRSGYFTGSTALKEPTRHTGLRPAASWIRDQRRPSFAESGFELLEEQPVPH